MIAHQQTIFWEEMVAKLDRTAVSVPSLCCRPLRAVTFRLLSARFYTTRLWGTNRCCRSTVHGEVTLEVPISHRRTRMDALFIGLEGALSACQVRGRLRNMDTHASVFTRAAEAKTVGNARKKLTIVGCGAVGIAGAFSVLQQGSERLRKLGKN